VLPTLSSLSLRIAEKNEEKWNKDCNNMEYIKSAIFSSLHGFIVVGWRFDDCKPHTRAHICSAKIICLVLVDIFFSWMLFTKRPTHVCLVFTWCSNDETFKDFFSRITSFEVPDDMWVSSPFLCALIPTDIYVDICVITTQNIAAGWWNIYFSYKARENKAQNLIVCLLAASLNQPCDLFTQLNIYETFNVRGENLLIN
jgi:hypothetical protein